MTAIIAEQRVTFDTWPLEAYTQQPSASKPVYSVRKAGERGTAVEALFGTRRRGTAVVIEERLSDRSPICVGNGDELTTKMNELEGLCETVAAVLIVYIAVKRCRDFVRWRAEAESLVAGGVAA